MSIEDYGGVCPDCAKPMLQNWTNFSHGLNYEACPHCGFAYGTGVRLEDEEANFVGEFTADEVWRMTGNGHEYLGVLKSHYTIQQIRAKLIEALNLGDEGSHDLYPSVFDYRFRTTHPAYTEAWKQKNTKNG